MLRAVISGAPEPTGTTQGVGTVFAGSPVVAGRFTAVTTSGGQTAVQLPAANPGVWGIIYCVDPTSARIFTDVEMYVAGATYDDSTPYVLAQRKALYYACVGSGAFVGFQFG